MAHNTAACMDSGPHHFEPRYDTKQRVENMSARVLETHLTPVLEDKVYLYDICTKCGITVKR